MIKEKIKERKEHIMTKIDPTKWWKSFYLTYLLFSILLSVYYVISIQIKAIESKNFVYYYYPTGLHSSDGMGDRFSYYFTQVFDIYLANLGLLIIVALGAVSAIRLSIWTFKSFK